MPLGALAATTVTVDAMGFSSNSNVIQDVLPFFGSTSEVTLNWKPLPSEPSRTLVNWNGAYSGHSAAYCGGTDCTLDVLAKPGVTVTLDSFSLGGWPNTDRSIRWSVIDLATSNVVASDAPSSANVSGSTGLLVSVGASSATGLRILFGPDGFNGGLTDVTFSASPVPEPGTVALWLAGLAGLCVAAKRRQR